MTISPEIKAAFLRWANSELASHYAQPCPDAVMNQLVDHTFDALDALAGTPATTTADIFLKMYPPLMLEYEPEKGDRPLIPNPESARHSDHGMIDSILADIRRLCPDIGAVLDAPNVADRRGRAA